MVDRLKGKVIIVTGAGRGIGAAIADECAKEGARVVVADLDGTTAQATAAGIGGGALGVATDVSSFESVQALHKKVVAECGQVDILINNAGWDKAARFMDLDPTVWPKILGVNLYGVLNTCKIFVPGMVERGSGAVVNIGSDAGRVGSSMESVYSAAKGGVIAFSKTLAREVARYSVRVNCVCPGPADTALFAQMGGEDPKWRDAIIKAIPFRRLAQGSDIAHAVVYLASDEATYVTGQTLSVSGGLTMI